MPESVIEAIGSAAAIINTVCWFPQAIRIFRTRDTGSLSLWSNLMLLVAVSLWFFYGLAIEAWPVAVANAFSMALVGTIVVMKLRHG